MTSEAYSSSILLKDLTRPLRALKRHLEIVRDRVVFQSPVPSLCKSEECIVGIDEAGRGPVLGPMVYGISYCVKLNDATLKKLGCADSKSLTEEKREDIFNRLCGETEHCGWVVDIISPMHISNCMLRRQKFSLNEISHGSAIALIKFLQSNGVNVSEVYVDTVGPPEKYEEKLSKIFPDVSIKVSKKADALYPIVSAASICAKVIRDLTVKNWNFSEEVKISEDNRCGSGYPGDPATKSFLADNVDHVFGFPNIVRFSWSTANLILKDNAAPVEWSDDEESGDENSTTITSFFSSSNKPSKHSFFKDRNLETVDFL